MVNRFYIVYALYMVWVQVYGCVGTGSAAYDQCFWDETPEPIQRQIASYLDEEDIKHFSLVSKNAHRTAQHFLAIHFATFQDFCDYIANRQYPELPWPSGLIIDSFLTVSPCFLPQFPSFESIQFKKSPIPQSNIEVFKKLVLASSNLKQLSFIFLTTDASDMACVPFQTLKTLETNLLFFPKNIEYLSLKPRKKINFDVGALQNINIKHLKLTNVFIQPQNLPQLFHLPNLEKLEITLGFPMHCYRHTALRDAILNHKKLRHFHFSTVPFHDPMDSECIEAIASIPTLKHFGFARNFGPGVQIIDHDFSKKALQNLSNLTSVDFSGNILKFNALKLFFASKVLKRLRVALKREVWNPDAIQALEHNQSLKDFAFWVIPLGVFQLEQEDQLFFQALAKNTSLEFLEMHGEIVISQPVLAIFGQNRHLQLLSLPHQSFENGEPLVPLMQTIRVNVTRF